jgi:two-component system, NtrC family, C4-dicarboxylate transport sensor histidine kinase DctB
LEQVFSNLISNAMDAAGPSAIPRISIRVALENRQAVIQIADCGPGIPTTCIDRIFEPFYTTKEHGLGLGLSISAGIIRAAGGSLEVSNRSGEEGDGAQFIIRLTCHAQDGNEDKGEPNA